MKKSFLLLLPLLVFGCKSWFHETKIAPEEFPKHGNYCGDNNPLKGEKLSAIDGVDLACKHRDKCRADNGPNNTACDASLVIQLKKVSAKSEEEKAAKKLLLSRFKNSPQRYLEAQE